MVLEAIFDFGVWLFSFIAEYMPSLRPAVYSSANLFGDLLSFGVWVIGNDMWLIFISSVAAWLTFKLVWGIVLFIYKLIPLI